MSKRQNEYLSALLTPKEGTEDLAANGPSPHLIDRGDFEPRPPPGMTLLARETTLSRLASGEVKQVAQLQLDPARVRVWAGNARHQASLTEDSCRDLIDAILAEGGQKVPAIVRRVKDDPACEYEVIAGTRRHWAISWLRAHNYPDFTFLAQVHALDDESAFRLSDIENRARKDVSDFERARSYREALEHHYDGRQARMAERLRLSKGWLSKMLTVAALPDWIVTAFASPADIQLATCYPLAVRVANTMGVEESDSAAKLLAARAGDLTDEQAKRRLTGVSPISAADVVSALLKPAHEVGGADVLFAADSAHGRRALSVLSANRNGVTVRLHSGSGASETEFAKLLREALSALATRGLGLK